MVRERIGSYVYGCDDVDLAEIVGEQLRQQRLTLALAESCTGGLITKRLTDAPGASDFLVAGFVTYADEAKVRSLRVSKDDLHEHGAVSGEVARAMARGARRAAHAQVALAVTGIAGPGGASEQKPVGTVWIGLSLRRRTGIRQYRFHGDRAEVRARSAQAALAWLWRWLR
jgi:nicotinamide-nucleotide amidase